MHALRVRIASLVVACVGAGAWLACGSDDNGGNQIVDPDPEYGTVSGVVRDDIDAGVGGVAIQLTRTGATARNTNTSSNGAFSFSSVDVGNWNVGFTVPQGYVVASGQANPVPVTVTANQTANVPAIRLDRVLDPMGAIEAMVREDGSAVPGVPVRVLEQVNGTEVASGTTAANGNVILNVPPAEYDVEITLPTNYEMAPGEDVTKLVAVSDGQTTQIQFNIVGPPPPSAITISMGDNFFAPPIDTVAVGGTVTWVNNGNAAHTVTRDGNGGWDSGSITPANQYQRAFAQAGTFDYYCAFHNGMTGTIVVRD